MPASAQDLEAAIRQKLNAEKALVYDISGGCGQSYEVVIVSELFKGKPTLARHRLVNDALKDEIASLHAFSQKTYTPEQFKTVKIEVRDGAQATS